MCTIGISVTSLEVVTRRTVFFTVVVLVEVAVSVVVVAVAIQEHPALTIAGAYEAKTGGRPSAAAPLGGLYGAGSRFLRLAVTVACAVLPLH